MNDEPSINLALIFTGGIMSNYYRISNEKEYHYCADIQLEKTLSGMLEKYPKTRIEVGSATQQEYFNYKALQEISTNLYTRVKGLTTKSGLPILWIKFGTLDDDEATSKYIVLVDGSMEIRISTNGDLVGGNAL